MANISRRTSIVASSIILVIIVMAATFVYGINDGVKGDKSDDHVLDEERVDMWFECLSQPPHLERCSDGFRAIKHNYEATGRLSPEYLKAIKMFVNNNQTIVDFHVCGLDPARCPPETIRRWWDWEMSNIESDPGCDY